MGRRHSDTKRLSTRYSASLRRFSGPTLRPTLDVSCGTTTFEIVVVASHVANFLYLYTCILSNSMAFQNSSETSEISEPWETYITSFSFTIITLYPRINFCTSPKSGKVGRLRSRSITRNTTRNITRNQPLGGFRPPGLNFVLEFCRGFLAPESRSVLWTGSPPLEELLCCLPIHRTILYDVPLRGTVARK